MTSRIFQATFDCAGARSLSAWWAGVLDYVQAPDDPDQPGQEIARLVPPGGGPGLLFLQVPEPKTAKNRLHFDLRPTTRTRDEEVRWLLASGATFIADHRGIHGPGTGWFVLADPEGNEFCVLRSDAVLAG